MSRLSGRIEAAGLKARDTMMRETPAASATSCALASLRGSASVPGFLLFLFTLTILPWTCFLLLPQSVPNFHDSNVIMTFLRSISLLFACSFKCHDDILKPLAKLSGRGPPHDPRGN